MPLNPETVRQQFPSLKREAIFLDNPAGTQIARQSLERINRYLLENNANHDGAFETSLRSDETIEAARHAMADLLNAPRPEEIVFGPNMTSLTFNISRSLARTWQPGDEIIVTRLDHDANITPWVLAAEERGCNVHWVDFDPEDGTLTWRRCGLPCRESRACWLSALLPTLWARLIHSSASYPWQEKWGRWSTLTLCNTPAWPNRRAAPGLRFSSLLIV